MQCNEGERLEYKKVILNFFFLSFSALCPLNYYSVLVKWKVNSILLGWESLFLLLGGKKKTFVQLTMASQTQRCHEIYDFKVCT